MNYGEIIISEERFQELLETEKKYINIMYGKDDCDKSCEDCDCSDSDDDCIDEEEAGVPPFDNCFCEICEEARKKQEPDTSPKAFEDDIQAQDAYRRFIHRDSLNKINRILGRPIIDAMTWYAGPKSYIIV